MPINWMPRKVKDLKLHYVQRPKQKTKITKKGSGEK